MNTKYKSKVGMEIVIPLIIIFTVAIFLSKDGYSVCHVLVLAPAIIFILYLFSNTYYTITDNLLNVKSGFLVNISIDINTITKIRETNNMLSAPALSLDRLEIIYGASKNVMVSPKDKKEFVEQLQEIKPSINFVPKK